MATAQLFSIKMDRQSFRDMLSLRLICALIFLTIFTLHTYAAFCHTAPSFLYICVGVFIFLEAIGTLRLVVFLHDIGDRSMQSILVGIAALIPCLIVWVLGNVLAWWPLAS